MLTVALTPMPQTIHAVVQWNKFQWPTRWAKFLGTTANASSCIASMISTTFCAVLGFHFIQSKRAQMPKCVGSFIHYTFVGCCCCCCCYRSSTSLCLTPHIQHTSTSTGKKLFIDFCLMNSRSFRSAKKEKFRHYILLMRFKNGFVEILFSSDIKKRSKLMSATLFCAVINWWNFQDKTRFASTESHR